MENRVFSQPASAAISNAYVAVRILGGKDDTDLGRSLRRRYGLSTYPSMLALTHDGAVLTRSFQRDVAGILSAMNVATENQKKFSALSATLTGKDDAPSLRRLATLYKDRGQFSEARSLLEQLTASKPDVHDQVALLEVLDHLEDVDATQALLKTLVAGYPDHADNIQWRIALALAAVPTHFSTREDKQAAAAQRVAVLVALLPSATRVADQAQVRLRIGRFLNRTPDREAALQHWDWILEHARESAAAPEALMNKATALYRSAAGNADKLERVKELLQELVDTHPKHPAADDARRYLPAVQRTIDKARAAEDSQDDSEAESSDDSKR